MTKQKILLFLLFLIGMVHGAIAQEREAYAVLSGNNTILTFYYDTQKAERNGMSVGPFKYNRSKEAPTTSWYPQCTTITTVVFHSSFADCTSLTSTVCWFYRCSKLTTITGIENLKTSNVTDMSWMFLGCSSLTSLDLSDFNTANVTDMSKMFCDCSSLTSLDLSNFNTGNVTDMNDMFRNCSSLTSLDVSNFNTANVTNMGTMFYYCDALTSLDLSNFNTANVTNMGSMFYYCDALTSLDLSNFNTANVTNMGDMFDGCSGLTSLDVSNFNTANVKKMYGMFSGCSGLTSLDVSNFNTANVTDMSGMFSGCSGLTSLDLSNFKTDNVTNMRGMFSGCSGLTSLDLSNFNTANVTNMRYMFSGCSGLTSLDLSNFNTANVTYMGYMFDGCSGLTSLDLSNFNTANVKEMYRMFCFCSGLETVYADETKWSTNNVIDGSSMFFGCTKLLGGSGTKFGFYADADQVWHIDNYDYAHIDGGASNPGYFTNKNEVGKASRAYTVFQNGTLTFYYDNNRSRNTGMVYDIYTTYRYGGYPDWVKESLDITKVVFDVSFANFKPTSTANWFSRCPKMTEIEGLDRLDTRNVTDMHGMFDGCSSLTSLDLSNFNTANVTEMGYMFSHCSGLTSLDLSNFNTANVTDMWDMFYHCSSLTSLDVSNFNTANVMYMNGMFSDCSSLTSLDVRNFNTANVTDMGWMFFGCSGLETIYADEWNTDKVTNGESIFNGCTKLVGGSGTAFDADHTDIEYARIDGETDAPGYLTAIYHVGTTITLNVFDDREQDITNNASIVWYDGDGRQIGTGSTLNGVIEDAEMYYSVLLDESLGRVYREVNMQKAEINEDGVVTCSLEKMGRVMLEGRVSATDIDKTAATVNVRQMLNGKWQQDYSTRTDAQGRFSIEVYDDTTDVTISGDGYLDVSLHRNGFNGDGNMGTIPMNLLTGFAVTANITMKESATSGEIAEVNVWGGNLNDIDFSLTNTTKGMAIEDIAVQNGYVIIKSGAKVGDEISLTAKSKQGMFADATTSFVLSEESNSFDLQLTELGGIDATCPATSNGTTIGYLYDINGMLAARGSYRGETLSLHHIESGTYTLVSMGQSLLLGGMTKLSDLSDTGLSEGTDYVTTTVNVTDGALTAVSVSTVPKMNDARFYHTTDNTYFSANKSMVTVGNYISMSAHVDFKTEYADKIDDVTLTIELPEGCQMLENTVIANRQSVPYTLNGNTITIPLTKEQYESSVRFCIVPTVHKDYTVTATASFNLDGQKQQPIGTAQFEAKGLSLSAPQMTGSTIITVTGMAKGRSEVSIYDNDVLIGKTTSKADGSWSAECELFKPFTPSFHDIYAKITTENGLELTSETQQVEYNKTSIVPQKVTMLYYNPEFSKNYNIVFDLVNGTTTPSNYYFFPYKNWPNWYQTRETEPKAFTFLADFTLNDPSRVKNVNIKVLNSDGTVRTLPATFDEKQGKWVATTKYSSASRLPQNVTVDYDFLGCDSIDNTELFNEQMTNMSNGLNAIMKYADDNFDYSIIEENDYFIRIAVKEKENIIYTTKIEACDFDEAVKRMDEVQFDFYYNENGKLLCSYTEVLEAFTSTMFIDFEDSIAYIIETNSDKGKNYAKSNNKSIQLTSAVDVISWIAKTTNNLHTFGGIIDTYFPYLNIGSIRSDISFMYDLLNSYTRNLDNIHSRLQELLNVRCSDGSFKLSTGDKNAFLQELSIRKEQSESFKDKLYDYIREYERRIAYSVAYDLALTYAGAKAPGLILKSLKFTPRSRVVTSLSRFLQKPYMKVDNQKTVNMMSNVMGVYLGFAIDGINRVLNPAFTDFRSVHKTVRSWAPMQYNSLMYKYITLGDDIELNYKKCTEGKNEEKKDEPYDKKTDNKSDFKGNGSTGLIDPSGYVYEAVLSNRLPGVTTTVYEQVNGVAVKWNAEEYSQENPLLTDETGFYRWDVPQGMWQVKYEKDGYETTYSEWLPVPPPQLDVNICMKQSTPPTVKQMRGYETGITVEMGKYMKPETMTAQNITVTRNGEVESGSIEMINAEKAPLGEETYVSKVRFVPENNFNSSDVVVVTIHKEVESYCGTQMTADHVETVKIESEVKGIVVDDAVTVPYQGERELRIVVLPKEASAGKKLLVSTSSQMIASLNSSEAVIDEDGAVNLTIGGELPGGAVLDFAVEGTDVTATTKAQVVAGGDIVETPTASISSGETIISGTKLTLSCTTSGATIYYTLDGSCPCDEASRILYNGPIAITKDVTVKAIAVKDGMDDSDVATFVYTVQYEQVETPQASIASTETVMSGQTLELTCATDGATIYYTLDGSSPTDEAARMKYSSPIVLTEDVTVKAMAVKDGMDDSDVATFVYAVTGIKGVVTDGIEEDTLIYNVSGQRLNKTRKGINIIGRKKVMMK